MRVHNFGAGPCTLPEDVLQEARREWLDYAGTGMSLVELSHRSPEYDAVHHRALDLTRSVSGAPEEFAVLFVQGGATLQFGMVPLNLLAPGGRAGYVVSGAWARKARSEAETVAEAYTAWDGSSVSCLRMPRSDEVEVRPGTTYLHITTNETIDGIRMVTWPATDVPLVADMSSEYLARPIEWNRYDLVYGGVQKNLAPAGLAVVFVRRSVLSDPPRTLPSYLRYGWHADSDSLGNTPAMFSIYIMGKVLERMERSGGIPALEKLSAAKAERVYDTIDTSDGFYENRVDPASRSHMNVVFRLPSEELERRFLAGAAQRRMVGLKGHRSVGGVRASLYAALEMESVDALVSYMHDFRTRRS